MPARLNRKTDISTVSPGAYSNRPPQVEISARAGLAGDGDHGGKGAEVHGRVDHEVGDHGLAGGGSRGQRPTAAPG